MNAERTALFSDAPVRKAVLTLAIPAVISQLITVVCNMADTFFIGKLNDPLQGRRRPSPCHASCC